MLRDLDGQEAIVDKTHGFWLDESDFVSTRSNFDPKNISRHGFPKNWPEVYTKSRALKSLIGKKGKLAGTSVHVVAPTPPEQLAQVADLELKPLQSFINAERVSKKLGLLVQKGWAVYELLSDDGSSCGEDGDFFAERHWFNQTASGSPVDFTPRAQEGSPMALEPLLLVCSREVSEKQQSLLSAEMVGLYKKVLARRSHGIKVATPPAPRKIEPSAQARSTQPPPTRKIEPLAKAPAAKQVKAVDEEAKASVQAPQPSESTGVAGRVAPPPPMRISNEGSMAAVKSASKPAKRTIDYSKFDNIEDSDEEEKTTSSAPMPAGLERIMKSPILKITQTPTDVLGLADYKLAFESLLKKADPPTAVPDMEAMFVALKKCPDTTDRALLDQACSAAEGVEAQMNNGTGFDTWVAHTAQLAQVMLQRRRFDESRMWCIIRHLRMPKEMEPLQTHAWCLEEQMNCELQKGKSLKVRVPTLTGFEEVDQTTYVNNMQIAMRAHLKKMLEMDRSSLTAYTCLVPSLERSGHTSEARKIAREGVKHGVWLDEWQRPTHFVKDLVPRQGWHDAASFELCAALEQVHSNIKEEFEKCMSFGQALTDVGVRSGEGMLVESGSWKELALFTAGRMDHEICSKFPETIRVLTERCADATGLAFCGGGEVAFRILSPGTKLKPHCGPTNARLTCMLGVSVPLGAEPGVFVCNESARPWIDGKCIVFDDSFEHYEELDEMAEGDSIVLLLHFWHPSFQHKNDPEWRVKGLQE